jgi:hypothetical protein
MAFLAALGGPRLTRQKPIDRVESLLAEGKSPEALKILQRDIDELTKYKITAEESKRISSSNAPGDLLDLTILRSFFCFINCSMSVSSEEMKQIIQMVNTLKETRAQILRLPPTASPDEIRTLFMSLKDQRQKMFDLRPILQAKYPPTFGEVTKKSGNNNSIRPGGTQWAENLARIYTSLGGPSQVSTNQFIKYLQNHRNELSPEEQATVHGALSEFGYRRENASVGLKNYLKKSGITIPQSFRSLINIKKGGKSRRHTKVRKTRRRKTRKN